MALAYHRSSNILSCIACVFGLRILLIAAAISNAVSWNEAHAARKFSTYFQLEENPISEAAVWQHRGAPWANVRTFAGRAVGTQTGTGGFDDAYAYLSGFGPNQTAQATLWRDPAIGSDSITCKIFRKLIAGRLRGSFCAGRGSHNVALLLRWADSLTQARGYSCNLSWDGKYAEISRWNGLFGDFTYIAQQRTFDEGVMPPKTGDIFKATISGDSIKVYLNKNDGGGDRLIVTGMDATFRDGGPGISFYIGDVSDPTQFGFTSFSASSE